MIGTLNGKVIFIGERHIVLDVSGVGYKLYVPALVLKKIAESAAGDKSNVSFWTHLYMRENALELYGFLEKAELDFFELLIAISGVGPKSAMGVMGVASVDVLKRAISSGDTSYLSKVSGIGKKTAEKIMMELRDKLSGGAIIGSEAFRGEEDVISALESMGYSMHEIRDAMREVPASDSIEGKIKAALKILGKRRS